MVNSNQSIVKMDLYSKECTYKAGNIFKKNIIYLLKRVLIVNMPIEYIEMKNKLKEYFAQEASRSSHNSHYSHSSTIEIQDSTVTVNYIIVIRIFLINK